MQEFASKPLNIYVSTLHEVEYVKINVKFQPKMNRQNYLLMEKICVRKSYISCIGKIMIAISITTTKKKFTDHMY